MPTGDHGNFDLAAELPESTLLAVARTMQFVPSGARPFTATGPAGVPAASGTVTAAATVSATTLRAPNRLAIAVDLAGTRIDVLKQFVMPTQPQDVAPWMQRINPRGTLQVDAPLAMTPAHALTASFGITAGGATLAVTLEEDSILASPLVTFILAQVILVDPSNGALYQQAKVLLLDAFRTALGNEVTTAVGQLGTVTLAPPPILPPAPSGALIPITGSALAMLPHSLKVAYQTTGVGGNGAAIGISNLTRSTATGLPVDAMALVLSNAFILRDLLRDGLSAALGIPVASFAPTHPLMFFGAAPIAVPGGLPPGIASVVCDSLLGGIDGTNVRLLGRFTATGIAGSFTATASIDISIGISAAPGSPPALTVIPLAATRVSSDLAIAWWVYVAAALSGNFVLLGVLAAADAFGGSLVNGLMARLTDTALGALGSMTVSAPAAAGLPPMTVRPPVSLGQPNAITRVPIVTIPGVPFPIPFPDPFGDNDVIVALV